MNRKVLIITCSLILILMFFLIGGMTTSVTYGSVELEPSSFDKIEIGSKTRAYINYSRTAALVNVQSWNKDYISVVSEKASEFDLTAYVGTDNDAKVRRIILSDRKIDPEKAFMTYTVQTWLPLVQFDSEGFMTDNKSKYRITIYVPNNIGIDVRGNNYRE